MEYIQLNCQIKSNDIILVQEILMHELSLLGYESFSEIPEGLNAYITASEFDENQLSSISLIREMQLGEVNFSWVKIPEQNWNEEWEKNFQPVLIAKKCYIRSPFHPKRKDVKLEIVIEPKMSFGTGHHETTSLMVAQMLNIDLKDKIVLDMGCGTGVLAILASKLAALKVTAIDIDSWAYQNSIENCKVNNANQIEVLQGDVHLLSERKFDVILANINRNILLRDIPSYCKSLNQGGILLLSGIYSFDLKMILDVTTSCNLIYKNKRVKNNWIAPLFLMLKE